MIGCLTETTTFVAAKPLVYIKGTLGKKEPLNELKKKIDSN